MGKRGNNEGSIRFRADKGLYEARYTGPDGKRRSLYAKTRAEVNRKLTEALRNQAHGLPVAPERLTLAQYLEDWIANVAKLNTRESTWRGYEQHARQHIIPALGRIPLMQLSPQDLNRFYAAKLKSGLSPSTVNSFHRTLHKALKDAMRADLVLRNVADLDSPPKKAEYEAQTFSVEEAQRFLEAIRGDRFEALYLLAIMNGMREGELLALTWDALDMERGTLGVRTSHRRMGGRFVVSPPKTKAGKRPLQLSPIVVQALSDHRARQDAECAALEAAGMAWEDASLVFPNKEGRRIAGATFYEVHYQTLLRRAQLPMIRFHDLRHTFSTFLLSLNINARIVADMLGHSSVLTTQTIYQHVKPEMQRDAVRALEALLFPKDGVQEQSED